MFRFRLLHLGAHFRLPGITPTPGKSYATLLCALAHPLSRGSVHISSSDALSPPAINPNYFGNPIDLDIMVGLIPFVLRVYERGPFGGDRGVVKRVVVPSEDVIVKERERGKGEREEEEAKEALREYARSMCIPVNHPVGTASMLPKEFGGVVDSSLKVYGTVNLRVVSFF